MKTKNIKIKTNDTHRTIVLQANDKAVQINPINFHNFFSQFVTINTNQIWKILKKKFFLMLI